MARPLPPDSNRLQGFGAGMNNVAPDTRPTKDEFGTVQACREAVNVDFDASGRGRLRRGTETIDARAQHSLHEFGGRLLACAGGDLVAYSDHSGLLQSEVLVPSVGQRFVSYASDDYDLYWSNGESIGRIDTFLVPHVVWPDTPTPPTVVAVAAGGLAAGQYEVAITAVNLEGYESGASVYAPVFVAAGGGVSVAFPLPPADAIYWNVYISGANDEELRLVERWPIAQAAAQIGAHIPGRRIRTDNCYPMPPGRFLAYWNGRLLSANGNTLVWSEPYSHGLTRPENCLLVGNEITLLVALESGVFVADEKRTYFFSGESPNDWRQVAVHPAGATPYSAMIESGDKFSFDNDDPVALWISSSGALCMGVAGGKVRVLRDEALALPARAEHGALAYFEFNGIRQVAASMRDGAPNARAYANDSVDFIVRRHGNTVT